MEECYQAVFESPIGRIIIAASDVGITQLTLAKNDLPTSCSEHPHLTKTIVQLEKYFAGELKEFDLPLDFGEASQFYMDVWNALLDIPYGKKASYKDLATLIGKPEGSQAVGQANGKNPIAIIVPCHRIIGSDGSLTGYASGIERKKWLLTHEMNHSPKPAHLLF